MLKRRATSTSICRFVLVVTTALASVPAMAQGDRLSISPSVSATYDSNIARRNPDFFDGQTDNMRYSPRIRAATSRQFGRTAVSLDGSLGYDFNSPRFSYLDREAITALLTVKLPVGSQCPIDFSAEHQQAQFDFNDTDGVTRALQIIRRFDVDLNCKRPGLSPNLGATYRSTNNSAYQEVRAGVNMTVPSIGILTLSGQIAKITSPNPASADTNIARGYLAIDRSVAPRLNFYGALGYVTSKRQGTNATASSGLSFKLNAGYQINSQLRLTVEGLQDIENSPRLNSPAVFRRNIQGGLDVNVIHKVAIQIRAMHTYRRFDDTREGAQAVTDTIDAVSLRASRTLGRKFNLAIGGKLMKRDSNIQAFAYDSTSITATLGARF